MLALVSLNLLISGQSCSDLRVYLQNQNPQNITNQIIFGTNYDSLVYVNPNTSAVNAIYDWRGYRRSPNRLAPRWARVFVRYTEGR